MFLTLEHEDPFVNTIISTIIKNEPDIVQYGQEIIDLYELTSKQLSECNIDELYKIRTIAKNKTIRNDDLSEEDIAFLTNDLDRTKKIIQETNSNIGFAKELLPYLSFFDSSIKDSLKEITDKMAELQSAQIKKQELASIVFGDCITSIKVDDFDLNNEIITVTNFKTKEELISALSSINRKIASAISNERQTISRLKSISAAKDRVLEYEKQIEKVKSMSDSELAQLLKDYAAEHLHMPVENQNDGAVEFQSKVFTAAIGLLPKNGEIIPTGDSLESIMDSYEEIAGKRTEILSKILAIPNSFCEFESNLQTLSDCVDRQFENLRLADGSIISNKLLIMAMATLPENEKDAATEEITCLLMQKVYDHCEGKTSKSTAMISPKFKLPRSKEIGGSIPRFCTQQKDINDDFKTITDIIATAWPVFIISSLAKTTEELPNPELFIKGEYPLIKTPEKSYSPINGFLDTLDSLLDLCSAYREMYTSQRVDNYFKSMSNDLRNDMQFQLSIIEIIKNVASRTSLKALLDAIAEMTELKPKLARAHGDRQKKAELTERYNNLIDLIALKLKIEGERAKIIRPQDS